MHGMRLHRLAQFVKIIRPAARSRRRASARCASNSWRRRRRRTSASLSRPLAVRNLPSAAKPGLAGGGGRIDGGIETFHRIVAGDARRHAGRAAGRHCCARIASGSPGRSGRSPRHRPRPYAAAPMSGRYRDSGAFSALKKAVIGRAHQSEQCPHPFQLLANPVHGLVRIDVRRRKFGDGLLDLRHGQPPDLDIEAERWIEMRAHDCNSGRPRSASIAL